MSRSATKSAVPCRHLGFLVIVAVLGMACRRDRGQNDADAPIEAASRPQGLQPRSPTSPAPPSAASEAPEKQTLKASVGGSSAPSVDSDVWVDREFQVQGTYSRVLAVGVPEGTTSVRVPRLALNDSATSAEHDELEVDERWPTLQQAADAARGGDLVVVWPGVYAGFELRAPPDTDQKRFIRFRALGRPGDVKITQRAPKNPSWMVAFSDASYIVFEGFEVLGQNSPGRPVAGTPRAGVFIDGNFRSSGRLAHHIAIAGVVSRGHRVWGLHSTDSRAVLIQDSYFAESSEEHGCYVSDGSDAYVIRRNVFANNSISGLQCNLDPDSSFDELNEHPKMHVHHEPTRAWVQRAQARAEKAFGPGNFPDGKGEAFIIERNVAYGKGKKGGAAFNLASLSRSVIRNNLLYANSAGGIAQWDNDNSFDYDFHDPGVQRTKDVKGPSSFPLFGCQQNVISNNTVVMNVKGRVALQSIHGSWGTKLYNNVLINESGDAIEIDNTSIYQFEAGPNAFTTLELSQGARGLTGLAKQLPKAEPASAGQLLAEFVQPDDTPWRSASGWQLAPQRPDFRPRPDSKLLVGNASKGYLPRVDLLLQPRSHASLGALEP